MLNEDCTNCFILNPTPQREIHQECHLPNVCGKQDATAPILYSEREIPRLYGDAPDPSRYLCQLCIACNDPFNISLIDLFDGSRILSLCQMNLRPFMDDSTSLVTPKNKKYCETPNIGVIYLKNVILDNRKLCSNDITATEGSLW